jgi:hypothetical protein
MDPVVVYIPRCVQNGSENLGLMGAIEPETLPFSTLMCVSTYSPTFSSVSLVQVSKDNIFAEKFPEDKNQIFLS